ncbi:MAG: DUF3078 domain-containing protein [Muribaculaceae bacterium]|nr:DUF3078 domain-containing protein [Muribaculaceae bacterium]
MHKIILSLLFLFCLTLSINAQEAQDSIVAEVVEAVGITTADSIAADATTQYKDSIRQVRKRLIAAWREKLRADSIAREDSIARANYVKPTPIEIPATFFGPVVFTGYEMMDSFDIMDMRGSGVVQDAMTWINREMDMAKRMRRIKQNYIINNPRQVKYNYDSLPAPPKEFTAVVDPTKSTIVVKDLNLDKKDVEETIEVNEVKRVNWLRSFDGSVQFSQAYISPNWYQGGNNNLNMIANAIYNVKLNQTFYPNLLFDTTVQYKLGVYSAPDDSLRNYSISEDIFRINSKFGLKAAKSWYYSVTADFKTQLFNGYKKNSNDLQASFLSPAELNIGLGMTYSYTNDKKKLSFDVSIAPLSYNLKICTNDRMDETAFGIDEGKTTAHQFGSSAEGKLTWKLMYNITYTSRLFLFSNYEYVQGDWEHRLSFDINRFLSTQIFVHLRYDSGSTHVPNASWKDWQMKEILSFGFNYKFSTI